MATATSAVAADAILAIDRGKYKSGARASGRTAPRPAST
jgi:hypothetical protein